MTERDFLMQKLKKGIQIILSGWQQTNFPISYREINNMQQEYLNLIQKENSRENKETKNKEKELVIEILLVHLLLVWKHKTLFLCKKMQISLTLILLIQ